MVDGICSPSFFKKGDVKLVDWYPPRFPKDMAKNTIIRLSFFPSEFSGLSSARETACDSLVNVDVLNGAVVLVMFNGKSDVAIFNGHSRRPTDTLKNQDVVDAGVREGLVLC